MRKLRLQIITLALFWIGLIGPVLPASFHDGVSAYERGDLVKALQARRSAANQGDALAQYNLGGLYANDRGVRKDLTEAAKWYRKAAEQGNPLAQYYLATLYEKGEGVNLDRAEAAKWCRKAAAHDVPQALEALDRLAR